MDLSTAVLGTSTVHQLQERQNRPVLRIGSDQFTRSQLAKVDCFNFTAASNLNNILNHELNVKSVLDLFHNVPPESLALPRLGAISLAVLGAVFEQKGLGGDAPLETWVRQHHEQNAKIVTWSAVKHRDHVERAAERKDHKRRKASRRDQAHRTRVERFETRSTANLVT